MRVIIDIGKEIIPRGQTVPVEMIFVETDDPEKNTSRAMNAALKGYMMMASKFLGEHPKDCHCPAFEMHTRMYASIKGIMQAEVSDIHVG